MTNLNAPNSNLSSNLKFKINKIGNDQQNGHFDPIKNTLSTEYTLKTTSNRQIPISHFLCRHPIVSINYNVSLFRALSFNYFDHNDSLRNSANALVVNCRQKMSENKETDQFTTSKHSQIIKQIAYIRYLSKKRHFQSA